MATSSSTLAAEKSSAFTGRSDRPQVDGMLTLPKEDQEVIFSLRAAATRAREKLERLRGELDARDDLTSQEHVLRKTAEERLKPPMIDLYPNTEPSVNGELVDRLTKSRPRRSQPEDATASGESILFEMSSESELDLDKFLGLLDDTGTDRPSKPRSRRPSSQRRLSDSSFSLYGAMPTLVPYPHVIAAPSTQGFLQSNLPLNNMASAFFPGHMFPAMSNATTPQPASNAHAHAKESQLDDEADLSRLTGVLDLDFDPSHSRSVRKLLMELQAAKELNKKLAEKVATTEKSLETLKIEYQTLDRQKEADLTGKLANYVEEVFTAQKKRDAAILEQIQREKENFLHQRQMPPSNQQLKNSLFLMDESDENQEMGDILSEIGNGEPSRMQTQTKIMIRRLQEILEVRQKIAAEEMQAMLEERDAAETKCRSLEQEVLKLRRQVALHGLKKEPQWEVRLSVVQQERDLALSKCQKLEDELRTLRAYHELHRCLFDETSATDGTHTPVATAAPVQKENNQLIAQLKSTLAEKEDLLVRIDRLHRTEKEKQDQIDKLERLVKVLRRKVNGLTSPRD